MNFFSSVLFKRTSGPSALIFTSLANTPEVTKLSSVFNLNPIFALPVPITFKNTSPFFVMNFACGFTKGAGGTVGGTAGISGIVTGKLVKQRLDLN